MGFVCVRDNRVLTVMNLQRASFLEQNGNLSACIQGSQVIGFRYIQMDSGRQGPGGSAVADNCRRGLLLRWIGYGMPIQHIHLSTLTTAAVFSATSSRTFPASALMHLLQEIQTVDRHGTKRDGTCASGDEWC